MIINAPIVFEISKEDQELILRGSTRDDSKNPPVDVENTSKESSNKEPV